MKYKVRLPSKSGSTSFPDVIRIVNRNPHWIDGKVQFVTFNELTEDFDELLDLCTKWKVTRLYIDNEELKRHEIRNIHRILFCDSYSKCSGKCSCRPLRGYETVDELVRLIGDKNYWHLSHLRKMNLLTQLTENSDKFEKIIYSVNHDKLLDTIHENFKCQEKFCSKFDWQIIEETIKDIPEEIETLNREYMGQSSLNRDRNTNRLDNMDEEQFNIIFDQYSERLSRKIAIEVESVLRNIFIEAGFLKK